MTNPQSLGSAKLVAVTVVVLVVVFNLTAFSAALHLGSK